MTTTNVDVRTRCPYPHCVKLMALWTGHTDKRAFKLFTHTDDDYCAIRVYILGRYVIY